MNGKISVVLDPINVGDSEQRLHFQFGTLAEFYLGLSKQRFGFSPFEDLHQELSIGLLLSAAIDAYNVINGIEMNYTIDQNLALLDRVNEADKQKVLEVANNCMGFINTAIMKMMAKMIELKALEEAKAKPINGMKIGKKERPLHSVVSD